MKYKVKDITLAEWGRKEIKLAEAEMPGLMSIEMSMVIVSHCLALELLAVYT